MKDKLILGTFDYIFIYKLNTFETLFKLSTKNLRLCNIYPFNEKILFYLKEKVLKPNSYYII